MDKMESLNLNPAVTVADDTFGGVKALSVGVTSVELLLPASVCLWATGILTDVNLCNYLA